jgi:tellurite methyltransferase
MNRSIDFFETQFRRQAREGDFALNPFERLALPYLSGSTLDLGCGLGNLAVEAARRGCSVLALDGSATAIARLREVAAATGLPIRAEQTDLSRYGIGDDYDTIVAIGLLMFFPATRALALLDDIRAHVRPGGIAVVNILVEGTTYLDMFDPDAYCLLPEDELERRFAGWQMLELRQESFAAPGATIKRFVTAVARKPHG